MPCPGLCHIRLRNKFACDVVTLCARAAHERCGVRADRNAHGAATTLTVADRVSPTCRRRQAVARRRLPPLTPAYTAPPATNINKLFRPRLNRS